MQKQIFWKCIFKYQDTTIKRVHLDYEPFFVYPEIMTSGKKKRSYALFCLFTTIIEEAAIIAAMLWFLPQFGITIPVWVIILVTVAWVVWSYLTYWLGQKTIDKAPVIGLEAMIGTTCKTTTPLSPEGYVRTKNELWRACSIAGNVDSGKQVVIVSVERLTLYVRLLTPNNGAE